VISTYSSIAYTSNESVVKTWLKNQLSNNYVIKELSILKLV
jgi:hypothetical protein